MKKYALGASFGVSLSLLVVRAQAQVNQCPIASNQTVTVRENLDVIIRGSPPIIALVGVTNPLRLSASDGNADSLQVQVTTFPAHGVLFGCTPNMDGLTYNCVSFSGGTFDAGATPRFFYIPDIQYRGTDSFSYTVNDGRCTSAVATVSINITPVNHTPVPVIYIEQLRTVSGLGDVVIAPGGGPLNVKVDATGTIDDGPFPLRFEFRAQNTTGQEVLGSGVVCLEYPAGTRFGYSNVGYSLLALIIEKVLGKVMNNIYTRIFGSLPEWKRPATRARISIKT